MKKVMLLIAVAMMGVCASASVAPRLQAAGVQGDSTETYKRLTGIPKPPVAGTTVDFVYHPQGGPLDGMKNLVALVYMYNSYKWELGDAALVEDGDVWRGTFRIPADCAFMAIQFQSTWDQFAPERDNNDNQGYLYVVSDGKGQPLPGGNLAWGLMRRPSVGLGVAGYFGEGYKEIDRDALYFWYQKELQQNQDKAGQFFATMMSIVRAQTGERFPEAAQMFIDIFSKQGKPTESNYATMEGIYRRDIKDEAKADSIHRLILKNYPDGWTVRREAFDAIYKQGAKNFHKNSVDFLKKYPQSESSKIDGYQPFVYYNCARAFATDYFTGQFDQKELFGLLPEMDFKTLAEIYRNTVGPFHAKKAVSDDLNYPAGKALIEEMLKKVEDKSYCEGVYMSPSQSDFLARKLLDEHLGNYADILLCRSRPEEALKCIGMITDTRRYQTPEVNETHVKALLQAKQGDKVEAVMKAAFRENAVTPAMMEMLKQDYVAKRGGEEGFDSYLASMKPEDEVAALKDEIRKALIDAPYTPFSLKSMDGTVVNSADWGGKVVVLDFWASWCYPCKNSFPGMQMAVDRFKDDPDVLFFFIDTMEQGDGYEQKARDYMEQKGFTFNVLFDAKADEAKAGNNHVVFSQMDSINKSMAIPRKMILKDGKVRYTAEGYAGSPSKLADEVAYAVEMLKNE